MASFILGFEKLCEILCDDDVGSLLEHINSGMFARENPDGYSKLISSFTPFFKNGNESLLHNHAYRQLQLRPIYFKFRANQRQSFSLHGYDVKEVVSAEFKTIQRKPTKTGFSITEKWSLGEIDKIDKKVGDEKYKKGTCGDFVSGIFDQRDGRIVLVFYVSSDDFADAIEPLVKAASAEYQQKSNTHDDDDENKKNPRDSLTLKIADFINCDSFRIIFAEKNVPIQLNIPNARDKLKYSLDVCLKM